MNKKIQYQQNIDIINKFFRMPIILITGILSVLSAFTFSVAFYYGSQPANNIINYMLSLSILENLDHYTTSQSIQFLPPIIINVFPILFGIAFIILFFFSEDDGNKTASVSKFFKITSLVKVIISIFVTFCIFCLSITTIFIFNNIITFLVFGCMLAVSAFFVIMNFSRYRFAIAINSSVNSIYLNKKGSVLFSIFNFICALSSLLALIFVISTHYVVGIRMFTLLPFIVYLVFLTAEKIFWGITSVKYSKYIKDVVLGKVKITDVFAMSDFEKQVTEDFLTEEINAIESNADLKPKNAIAFTNPLKEETPVNDLKFPILEEPEPQFNPIPNAFVALQEANSEIDNVRKEEPEEKAFDVEFSLEKFKIENETASLFSCPDCGTPFTEEDFFCNVCGRKLI